MADLPDITRLFIERCDAFAAGRKIKRSTLSVWLFNDGKRLDQLGRGQSDIGVHRLHRAFVALTELEKMAAG